MKSSDMGVQNTAVKTDNDINQSTLRGIKSECEIIWERIQESRQRLETRLEGKPNRETEKSNVRTRLLLQKERRLKAELEILRSQDVEVLSKNPNFVKTLLQNDVRKTKEQLESTLFIIKGQRQELAGEIHSVKQVLEQQEEINKVLQQKLLVYQDQDDVVQPQNKLLDDLQQRKKQAKNYNSNCMKQLGTFILKHFPSPSDDKKKEKVTNGKQPRTFCSLLHFIEVLMNSLFDNPHNPYIQQLPTYWPPYVELLLRYGIIQRHPNDCNLICLIGYHLK